MTQTIEQLSGRVAELEAENMRLRDASKIDERFAEISKDALEDKSAIISNLRRQLAILTRQRDFLIDWFIRGGLRSELDPHGHIRQTTKEIVIEAINSIKESEVK